MDTTLLVAMAAPLALGIWLLLEYISYKRDQNKQ